jgi:hypothetical protein
VIAYKCTRANGRDFYADRYEHAVGVTITEPEAVPAGSGCCSPGLHVSPTARLAARCSNGLDGAMERASRPWRFFQVAIEEADVLDRTADKWRVRSYRVEAELSHVDVFGQVTADLQARVAPVRAEIATWKSIPWLKPARPVTAEDLAPLLAQWHDALAPWLVKRRIARPLPRVVRIITDRKQADAAADADADDDDAADAADAATSSAAATAAAAAADADDAAADADADADAAAADAFYRLWSYWTRWYVRPRYALWRMARWDLFMGPAPNPWRPLVEIFKLGCAPIGYSGGTFCVYVPVLERAS